MDPFLGEIRIFSGNFVPNGWASCNGQLLAIRQFTSLYSLIGTTFGGDGVTSFGLPNFQGRIPVGQGQGPGFSQYRVGQTGGTESVTLNSTQMASHSHFFNGDNVPADQSSPGGNMYAALGLRNDKLYADGTNPATFANGTIQPTGGSQPHENRQSFLTLSFIIALSGIFPTRP